MARLQETGIGGFAPFVKPAEVAEWDSFTMIGARHKIGFQGEGQDVAFTIVRKGESFTMTMKDNEIRSQYVKYFETHREPITNLRLIESENSKKGNPAWIFVDDGSEVSDSNELEYVQDETYQGGSDIPF